MYTIVGYRPIRTKKGQDAYILSYTKPLRAGQKGYGIEAGEQFIDKAMFDSAVVGVAPEKIVGMLCALSYSKGGFCESFSLLQNK